MNPRHAEPLTRESQLTRFYGLRSQVRHLKADCDALHLLVPAVHLATMEYDLGHVIKLLEADLAGVPAPISSRE